jgi:hypothetical protein
MVITLRRERRAAKEREAERGYCPEQARHTANPALRDEAWGRVAVRACS